jgi:hypothetical protein
MTPMKLTDAELRAIARWTAACAARVLPVFETIAPADARPREALDAIRAFARGGKRTAHLRTAALAALAAAREVGDPVAAAAARAAGTAAASAYMHPLATTDQAKHLLAPAAYAAQAREPDDARELRWAIQHAPSAVRAVLRRMPAREAGRGRLNALMYEIDAGLRRRVSRRVATGAAR